MADASSNHQNHHQKMSSSLQNQRKHSVDIKLDFLGQPILVVDDDATMRNVLSRFLEKSGYKVECAEDGRTALSLLLEKDYLLILVDVFMPEMDGITLIRMFKQVTKKDIPTIMISGTQDPETISKSLQIGAEDFLSKPIKFEFLKARIEKCLEYRTRKVNERALDEAIIVEKKLKDTLNEKYEKNRKELEDYKKVSETIETPIQTVVATINDLVKGKYEQQQYKLALVTILKSLVNSDLYKPAFADLFQKANMDQETRAWLVNQFTQDKEEFMKQIREDSLADSRSLTSPSSATLNTPSSILDGRRRSSIFHAQQDIDIANYQPPAQLSRLDYNVFEYSEEELKKQVIYMFKSLNIHDDYDVDLKKLWNFLGVLQKVYRNNPYHNFRHCIDVTQYVYMLVQDQKVSEILDKFEKFVLLTSALCHDIDHPGVNNNYLMNTQDDLALLYNDVSVLENHHAASAFKLLSDDNINILSGLSPEGLKEFRKLCIQVILATDMANHFAIVSKFETRITTGPLQKENADDRLLLMRGIIKTADINNLSRPFSIAKEWAGRVIAEFTQQGDMEKKRGLPISPLMDKETLNFPKSQRDFGDFIAIPLFKHLCNAVPSLSEIRDSAIRNRNTWDDIFQHQEAHPQKKQ